MSTCHLGAGLARAQRLKHVNGAALSVRCLLHPTIQKACFSSPTYLDQLLGLPPADSGLKLKKQTYASSRPSPIPDYRHLSLSYDMPKRKAGDLPKYYAVRVGVAPGVYRSWAECQAQITGHPGATCTLCLLNPTNPL